MSLVGHTADQLSCLSTWFVEVSKDDNNNNYVGKLSTKNAVF